MAAVTTYYKLSDLKQQKFTLLILKPRNQYHWAEITSVSRGSRGESIPYLLQLLMAAGIPWLVPSLQISKEASSYLSDPLHATFSGHFLFSPC